MPDRVPQIRRGPAERVAAWATTGPLGHLWSTAADVVVLWVRYGLVRARTGPGQSLDRIVSRVRGDSVS